MNHAATVRDAIVAEVSLVGFRAHGLHVLAGDSTAEHRWTADVREEIHSVAKGVAVLAVGIAADEGLIALDEPAAPMIADVAPGSEVSEVTLRHLLTMTSGIDLPWSPSMMTDHPDLAVEFLSRPSRGRVFQYSNASTYTAMRALAARVGDVGEFLETRLFEPLGLRDVVWQRCSNGFVLGGEGIALRTEEVARLGRLLRDRGTWQGRRLVSPGWIDAMHAGWVRSPSYDRYGMGAWEGPGTAWRLHGAYGQLVILQGGSVVTITADDHDRADAVASAAVRVLQDVRGS